MEMPTFDAKVLMILTVVAVSGCVGGLQGFQFGQTQSTQVEAPDDVLLIKNAQVVPTPPIPADSTFDLSFLVENTGTAEQGREAESTDVVIFDWGRCTPQDQPDAQTLTPVEDRTIFPGGGAVLIEEGFRAPTNTELGGVQGTCTIRYRVEYNFNAFSVNDLIVVDTERLSEANRAGETINVNPVSSRSKGPLKIDILIGADQPVREGSTVPLRVEVRDEGEGLMREIPEGDLTLEFPDELSDGVNCDENSWTGSGTSYSNSQAVTFINKKTPPLRCDVTIPEDGGSGDITEDVKTLQLNANLQYRYRLFGETPVSIEPTAAGGSIGGGTGGGDSGGDTGDDGGGSDGDDGGVEAGGR